MLIERPLVVNEPFLTVTAKLPPLVSRSRLAQAGFGVMVPLALRVALICAPDGGSAVPVVAGATGAFRIINVGVEVTVKVTDAVALVRPEVLLLFAELGLNVRVPE